LAYHPDTVAEDEIGRGEANLTLGRSIRKLSTLPTRYTGILCRLAI